jgi:hypothetical protein
MSNTRTKLVQATRTQKAPLPTLLPQAEADKELKPTVNMC